jgi:hypothetical protein
MTGSDDEDIIPDLALAVATRKSISTGVSRVIRKDKGKSRSERERPVINTFLEDV